MSAALPIVGRDRELAAISDVLAELRKTGGRCVLVTGDPGLGKTTLVNAVAEQARSVGARVLSVRVAQGAGATGYAGLHELLAPILEDLESVPVRQRTALLSAFGLVEGPPPDRILVQHATLGLLETFATRFSVVLLIDDLQWIDPSSLTVLDFVARRLTPSAIVLVAAARMEAGTSTFGGLNTLRIPLEPLSDRDSAQLLATLPQRLEPHEQDQVIRRALGNPLALHEFASTLAERPTHSESARLTTTTRLDNAFLTEVGRLPAATQRYLVLAAAGEREPLADLIAAGRTLGLGPEILEPAERSGLVDLSGTRLQFRHALVRSAVYGAASWNQLAEAHGALAATARDQSGAVWHRAALVLDVDEDVATNLEAVAAQALARGALPEAVASLRRAAELSASADSRARRLSSAASVARQAGMVDVTASLVAEAFPMTTDAATLVELTATQVDLAITAAGRARGVEDSLALAARLIAAGSAASHAAALLVHTAEQVFMTGARAEERDALADALRELPPHEAERTTAAMALIGRPAMPLDPASIPTGPGDLRPRGVSLLTAARAAEAAHNLVGARRLWEHSVSEFGRDRAGFCDLAQALAGRGLVRVLQGDLAGGRDDARRAAGFARERGLLGVEEVAAAIEALVVSWIGSDSSPSAAEAPSGELSGQTSSYAGSLTAWAVARRRIAGRRYADAYALLRRIEHPSVRLWAAGEVAEATAGWGRGDLAQGDVAAAESQAVTLPSLRLVAVRARAHLEPTDLAARSLQMALSRPAAEDVPLERGRCLLLLGRLLRHNGQIKAAREPLGESLRLFEEAGARLWSEIVAEDLRAAGVAGRRSVSASAPLLAAPLTAQELEIARHASAGWTNKQIGDKLFLSHRTVGSHLYRIFPKLAITKRSQLADAMRAHGLL